jgi:hypothetical protein
MSYLEEVDELDAHISDLKSERDSLLYLKQQECKHPIAQVREIDHESCSYGSAQGHKHVRGGIKTQRELSKIRY